MRAKILSTILLFVLMAFSAQGFAKEPKQQGKQFPNKQAPMVIEIFGNKYPMTLLQNSDQSFSWAELYPFLPKEELTPKNVKLSREESATKTDLIVKKYLKKYEAELEKLSEDIKDLHPIKDPTMRKIYLEDKLTVNGRTLLVIEYQDHADQILKTDEAFKEYSALLLVSDNILSHIKRLKNAKNNQ